MSTSPAVPTSPESPAPVKEGDILASKYRVERVLGVGGMGVVVAAHHVDLDQKVALKFLLPAAATNDELVNRFLREARASVRLKGSHVAKVLDVGRLEDGCPYMVMEFLDGSDLTAVIRAQTGPLQIEDAVSYILQAAEGIAEAHALGIVHRDIKPGNLFLTRGVDGRPMVKVLDFGISKTIDTSIGGEHLSLTRTEMLLGSPLYMSPEQMRSSKHVDERSDLWALGAIAYELLTGRVPFAADTILELCFKVAQEKAPNPKELRADLPDALCDAILRCLEKDPAARFANVGELARALEPFGHARDRGTAERALDVLGAGKRPVMRSSPELGTSAPRDAATKAEIIAPAGTAASTAENIAPAAWGTTQAHSTAKSRKGVFAVAGAAVIVAAIAGVAVSRGRSPDVAAPAPSASAASAATPPPSAASGAPTSAISASPSASPAAASEPHATSSAAPSASSVPASSPAPVRPSFRPQATAPANASASTKPVKLAGSSSPPATSAAPGGFIRVRE